jgi:hypothetical protein
MAYTSKVQRWAAEFLPGGEAACGDVYQMKQIVPNSCRVDQPVLSFSLSDRTGVLGGSANAAHGGLAELSFIGNISISLSPCSPSSNRTKESSETPPHGSNQGNVGRIHGCIVLKGCPSHGAR